MQTPIQIIRTQDIVGRPLSDPLTQQYFDAVAISETQDRINHLEQKPTDYLNMSGGTGALGTMAQQMASAVAITGGNAIFDSLYIKKTTTIKGRFTVDDLTIDRDIQFPDKAGTMALTSDLGTMAPQNANAVAITGGSISYVTINNSTIGLTSLPVHDNTYHDGFAEDVAIAAFGTTTPVGWGTGGTGKGQTYVAGVSKALTHVQVYVNKIGTPTDGLYAVLYNTVDGLPSGDALAYSGIVQARDIVGDGSGVGFFFPPTYTGAGGGVLQTAGTTYAIVIFRTGAIDADNYYRLINGNNSGYTDGNIVRFDGTNWYAGGEGYDLKMETYYGTYTFTGIILDQLIPANGILPVENLGIGAVTAGNVLVSTGAGAGGSWTDSPTFNSVAVTSLTVNGASITGINSGDQDLSGLVPYTGATTTVTLAEQNLTQTTGYIQTRQIRITNATNEFYTSIAQSTGLNTANRELVLPDYNGTILLNQQVILASENASTNPYTVSANVTQVYVTAASGITLNLPSALPNNKVYIITNWSGGGAIITPSGGETIQGGSAWGAGTPFASVMISKQGTDWRVVSDYNYYLQPLDAGLTDISALAVTDGNIIVGDGTNWVAESGATARTSLGLGTMALIAEAGSTNITTLGTVGTGIWQGTTIKANYLQQSAADLGAANITVDLSNSNGSYVTNLTIDGTFTGGNINLTKATSITNVATIIGGSNVLTEYLVDGEYYRTAIVEKPILGNGIDLEASSSQYGGLNGTASLNITGAITIEAWIKLESVGFVQFIGGRWQWEIGGGGVNYRHYGVYIRADNKSEMCLSPDGTEGSKKIITGSTALTAGTWYHIMGIYDGAYIYLYINNVSDATPVAYSSGILDREATPSGIGAHNYGAGTKHGFLDGIIDEMRIYNKALSAAERSANYNGGKGRYGVAETGLAAGWHFDENTGTSAVDYSGNDNTITTVNNPTWSLGKVGIGSGIDVTRNLVRYIDGVAGDEAGILQIGDATNNDNTIRMFGSRLAFYGGTPVVQAAHIADPTGGATVDAECRTALNAVLVVLENLGINKTT